MKTKILLWTDHKILGHTVKEPLQKLFSFISSFQILTLCSLYNLDQKPISTSRQQNIDKPQPKPKPSQANQSQKLGLRLSILSRPVPSCAVPSRALLSPPLPSPALLCPQNSSGASTISPILTNFFRVSPNQ